MALTVVIKYIMCVQVDS